MQDNLLLRATAPESSADHMPSSLLVFAHADDETVALGARLRRFGAQRLITITDGAPRDGRDSRAHGFASLEDYRAARRKELAHALSLAGFHGRTESFDIPDQEAALHLSSLVSRLRAILRDMKPLVVFTHPYEGGHPDHDACAYAVHRAVAASRPAQIVEASFYHAGPDGVEAGTFLPAAAPETVRSLSPAETAAKQALIDCFTSQRETLRLFPLDCERFRLAPAYDFHTPPPAARILYEAFGWPMTAQRFCQLARAADAELAKETLACA